jgi:hypothetical protein
MSYSIAESRRRRLITYIVGENEERLNTLITYEDMTVAFNEVDLPSSLPRIQVTMGALRAASTEYWIGGVPGKGYIFVKSGRSPLNPYHIPKTFDIPQRIKEILLETGRIRRADLAALFGITESLSYGTNNYMRIAQAVSRARSLVHPRKVVFDSSTESWWLR